MRGDEREVSGGGGGRPLTSMQGINYWVNPGSPRSDLHFSRLYQTVLSGYIQDIIENNSSYILSGIMPSNEENGETVDWAVDNEIGLSRLLI